MTVDIEKVLAARVAVADVRRPLDVPATEEKRHEQYPGEGEAAAQPGGHLLVYGGAPSGAEALVQGAVGRRAGLRSPPGDNDEPGGGQGDQARRHPAAR